jgi:hypothetical protein
VKGAGVLDYVCSWYVRAAEYIDGTDIRVAFVSTNSITQGEQVGALWHELIEEYGLSIHFAHTTFAWESEARGKAHVHVVIIGFSRTAIEPKELYEYDSPRGEPHRIKVKRINPYLADAPNVYVYPRSAPLNGGPPISYGSMMIDKPRSAGDEEGLVISPAERKALLAECPDLQPYLRRLLGGDELINGIERWCLWLEDAPPALLRQSPRLRARIEAVRRFRLSSGRPQTRELAAFPTLFGERRQPRTRYLLVPKVSSESRRYIPIGFCDPSIIASGSALIVPGATPYHFGVLSSAMHNAWMRYVGGRMKSDYQYSSRIVYNNFPWPHEPDASRRNEIEEYAKEVLAIRTEHPGSTLAAMYDPLQMPPKLVRAHAKLDRAVEKCYRPKPFLSDRERVEHLFTVYQELVASPAGERADRGMRKARAGGPDT